MPTRRIVLSAAVAAAYVFASAQAGLTEDSLALTFTTHAAFFSHEMKLTSAVDPQVFVKDTASKAAKGPQNIEHVADFRPARISADSKSAPLFDAKGKPLGLTLGAWLGATGSVTILRTVGGGELSAKFAGLVPGGYYSLFENHFDQKPIGFTPIDGEGKTNSFIAGKDGTAAVKFAIPTVPTHANAVLLVYHSDGRFHGKSRGRIGVDAHHQLIARP